MLLIYIAEKFPLFIPSKDESFLKTYANFFAGEEDRMTSVDSKFNFLCGRPPETDPSLPSTCGHQKRMAPNVVRL